MIFEELMTKTFLKLVKDINLQKEEFQGAQTAKQNKQKDMLILKNKTKHT